MSGRYYIGLDNGGSVTKAGLFDSKGTEIAVASVPAQLITPCEHFVETDAEELFKNNVHCIKAVIEKAGISPDEVVALSVTGFGNGVFLVGHDGKPSYHGVISTDSRADGCVKRWHKKGIPDKTLPKTMQMIWAGQLVPLLCWFKENKPEVLQNSKHAFSVTDYVRFRLTGEAYGEITNMSGIQGMNLAAGEYDDDVLKLLEVYEYKRLLAPICLSHQVCGGITKEVANETGLTAGTPVAGGLFDICACPLSTGIIDADQLSVVAGTWSINSFLSKHPVADKNLFMSACYPVAGYYILMDGSMTSASNLEWFVQRLMEAETKEAQAQNRSVYEICNDMVGSLEPEEVPIIFLPYLYGTNANANAKSCFVGLSYPHHKMHLIRAVYEGVVFSAMMHIEKLLRFRTDRPKSVRISGGAAKSPVWVQIFADVLQMPIEVSCAKELGAMGAAICAAVAIGDYPSYTDAVKEFVKIKYVCNPNPAKQAIYQKKYGLYKQLVANLDPLWDDWTELTK